MYHLTHRGNDRCQLFNDDQDYESMITILRNKNSSLINIYHYALMPNHLHIQLEPLAAKAVSRFMQKVCASYTRYFHKKYGSSGHIWQPRFFLGPIDSETYFLRCARYIELNPVRAGIVNHPQRYKWSSYNHSTMKQSESWLTTHPILQNMHDDTRHTNSYELFVKEDIDRALNHTSETFPATNIYGSDSFRKRFLQN